MLSRKPAAGAHARSKLPGNGRSAAPRAAATLTTAARGFVEFHPSMSLENVPTLADCLAVLSEAAPSSNNTLSVPDANDATLDGVLADRLHVWTKVAEVIDKLRPVEAYQGDVHALQKLLQLHLLCKQRETHLRTLQLTLLQEGRALPSVEAVKIIPSIQMYLPFLAKRESPGDFNVDPILTRSLPFPRNVNMDSDNDDKDIDAPNANQIEWQEEQERRLDIVDYEAMDLIELSEQFS